jgi:hypothetical protein
MVRDAYYSWTARCWNGYAMQTEHEGFASSPAWYTDTMYSVSGTLVQSKCNKYGIDKCMYNQQIKGEQPTNLFLFGKVDDQHAFTMAINLDKSSDKVTGYYYYDDKLQSLTLTGRYTPQTITLTETVNKRPTGKFEIKIDREYKKGAYNLHYNQSDILYLSGSWSDPTGKASLPITIDESKVAGSLKRLTP